LAPPSTISLIHIKRQHKFKIESPFVSYLAWFDLEQVIKTVHILPELRGLALPVEL